MQMLEGSSTSPSTPIHPSKEKDNNDEGTDKEEKESNGLNETELNVFHKPRLVVSCERSLS